MKMDKNYKGTYYKVNKHSSVLKRICQFFLYIPFCLVASFYVNANALKYDNLSSDKSYFQQTNISGVISDSKGPLAGVSIVIKGTANGTQTDSDGSFTLSLSGNETTLVVSYIGYSTQEIIIGNRTKLDITLVEDASKLDEIVVMGYTTRKKGEITGSVSTVNAERLEKIGNKDLAKSLAGVTTGLIVSDRGGPPGTTDSEDLTLLIRGKSTLGNNSPLILVDNIPVSSFSYLSPQDIETLTVLKDGAAAIYGARAANGVILITTRRGKEGKVRVSFNSAYNFSKFSETPKLMTSEQYAIYQNEIAERNNAQLPYTQEDINKYASGTDPVNYPNTNWADLTFNKYSPEYRNTLSISGGTKKVSYFVSADALDQVGMYRSGTLNFKQNQIRSNIDVKVIKNLKIGIDLSGRFGTRNEPGVTDWEIYNRLNTNSPTQVGIYPNGNPGWGGENGQNPYVMSTNQSGFSKRTDNNLRGKFSFNLDLNEYVKGLSIKGFAGLVRNVRDTKRWYTPFTVYQFVNNNYVSVEGFSQTSGTQRKLRESFNKYNELLLNSTVHYKNTFSQLHSINGFIGAENSSSDERNFWVEKRGFPSKTHSELLLGDAKGQISDGTASEWARVNFFGSLSYDYDKKYFVDFTLRYDGSSNFGPGKKFGTFPSIGVSWAIDKEPFMDNFDWLNSLKLRASYAKMGNDRIDANQYTTKYNYGGGELFDRGGYVLPNSYILGSPGNLVNGFTFSNYPNPNITWESAYMRNIGVNFSVLNNKLSGDINYYYQKREDILVTRAAAIPDAVGITLPQENIGKVDNFGWEVELGWKDKIGKEIGYSLGFNFTQAKNEVVYLAEAADTPEKLKREGHPMDSYIVYPTKGLFKTQAEVDAEPAKLNGTLEGDPYYIDTNKDGQISSLDRERSYTSSIPEIQYGIFGSIDYKNFNFSFLLQGQANVEILVFFERPGARPAFLYDQRWTPNNRDARYPRAYPDGSSVSGRLSAGAPLVPGPGNAFEGADLWYHDASFLRLKQVELGYTFNKKVIKVGELRLFVRGFNLLTMFSEISDLNLDPEATGYYDFRQSTYPSLTTYTGGLAFTF